MLRKILFVCIKNSSRSQMAEALLKTSARRGLEIRSAGITPGKEVNPQAVKAMAEVGIDIRGYKPNHISDFHDRKFDFVAKMDVPDLEGMVEAKWIEDWNIPDPAQGGIAEFRHVRELLDEEIGRRLGKIMNRKPKTKGRAGYKEDQPKKRSSVRKGHRAPKPTRVT